MNISDNQSYLNDFHHSIEEQAKEALSVIDKIANSRDAEKLFVALTANMAIGPAEEMDEVTYGPVPAKLEILAFCLYPHFGNSQNGEITPWDINECLEALEKLFTARSLEHIDASDRSNDPSREVSDHVLMQAKIVRGSAYPEQTSEEIINIQGKFESWFQRHLGIGPKRAVDLIWAIFKTQQDSLNSFIGEVKKNGNRWENLWIDAEKNRLKGDATQTLNFIKERSHAWSYGFVEALNILAPMYLPVDFQEVTSLTPAPTLDEWTALINLIGFTVEKRKACSTSTEVRQTPLFVLTGNKVLLIDRATAFDVLWEKFEQIAKTDSRFFQQKYQVWRTKWLEERIYYLLSKVFPSESIYSNLTYLNPDFSDKSTAEIDTIVQWGPFLCLIEAKAKQFRFEGQLGDIGRLTTDLKQNIEEAHAQAKRALRYIDSIDQPVFQEIRGNRQLKIQKQVVQRIYLITISQHHLADLANDVVSLQKLGLFKENEFPYSVSISDFEIITEFCENPNIFLHYIERRYFAQKNMKNYLADELNWFGAYLDTRLQPYRFEGKKDKKHRHKRQEKNDIVSLGGWSDQFDRWFMYKRGDVKTAPDIYLHIPEEIQSFLIELGKRDDYGARWISFALLDLPDDALHTLAKGIRELKSADITSTMLRRTSVLIKDTVITLVASKDVPPELLNQRTALRVEIEKYRKKAKKSIGFSIEVNDTTKPFNSAFWVEGLWHYDEKLERLIDSEPPFVPARGEKLPDKNSPCFCGSGKKFRNCCWPKVLESRKLLSEDF